MADSAAMDPVTAAINYLNSLASGVLNIFGLKAQRKIEQERTAQLEELTTQERIKYQEILASGGYALAMQYAQERLAEKNSGTNTTYLIIGGTFLLVLAIIIFKSKKQ